MTLGWECPKCGAVMAPHVAGCINCKGITYTISYTPYYSGCIHDWGQVIYDSEGNYQLCNKCGEKQYLVYNIY